MSARSPVRFVVFGDDWGRHVSTMQHIFAPLLGRVEVVWVNAIGHREPTFSMSDLRRAANKARSMVSRGPGLPAALAGPMPAEVIAPRVLPWHGNPLVSQFNHWSLHHDITGALARRRPARATVLVTGSPPSAGMVGRCGEDASIYFCMDDFLELPGTSPRMLLPLEQQLLQRVDAVVATAQELVRKKRCASGRGYHLPQGVNYAHFAARTGVPAELRDLPRPLIGFAGGVGTAVDLETVRALAERFAQGTVVLVGPVTVTSDVLALPNVCVLGARAYASLPAYVQAFDVGIVPYVENEWTRAVDPLKLLEYLAAGIPVVAAPIPEVWRYDGIVDLAPLGRPFVDAVARVLTHDDAGARERGRAVAAENTWARRSEQFLAIVDEVLAARKQRPRRQEHASPARGSRAPAVSPS